MITNSKHSFANTARWIAAARAIESLRSDCLFSDPFAHIFADDAGREMLARSDRAYGGENPFLAVRTRYFDDMLLAYVQDGWQVVLPGAGFDVRAYRLPLPESVCIFELDHAELLAEKEQVLAQSNIAPKCARKSLVVDLASDWIKELLAAGYQVARPTVWIAEGLLFYMPAAAVTALLQQARRHSATGSLFLADMFGSGLLKQPQMQSYLRWLEQAGLPPPFCVDKPAELLAMCGWQTARITQPGAEDANYSRFPKIQATTHSQDGETNRSYLVCAITADDLEFP